MGQLIKVYYFAAAMAMFHVKQFIYSAI
jgi:hypothetical protein